jgi:hypothetical protein
MLLVCLMVLGCNSERLKLIPHFWVPAVIACCLDLILEADVVEIKDLKLLLFLCLLVCV